MLRYLGYVGSPLGIHAPIDRTVRLANATRARLTSLIAENLDNLATVLRYDAAHGIRFHRMSSQIIPFASHLGVDLPDWPRAFAPRLRAIGDFVRANGMRVSMHPGRFTLLNARDRSVREAAMRELRYHVVLLETMGLGLEHKVVLHVGGVYGDRAGAIARFVQVMSAIDEAWRGRLAVENDERSYGVEDVLLVASAAGIPAVFDWLHYRSHPRDRCTAVEESIARCFGTWTRRDGPPKAHFSGQARGARPGAHSDWADPGEFRSFLAVCPLDVDFDCMLECKRKDLALLRLRDDLRQAGVAAERAA